MSTRYEVEVLLRPAVEVYSAIVCVSAAVIMWLLPDVLFLPPVVAQGSTIVLLGFALLDARAARRVLKYRSGLRSSRPFSLPLSRLPQKRNAFYLGRGFRWDQRHTQRLADTYNARYARFLEVPDNVDAPAWLARLADHNRWLKKFTQRRNQAGGNPALHGVELNDRHIFMDQRSRQGNLLVFGTTGAGKTRIMEGYITQDIHQDDVVIVVDPKGDGELLRRMYIESTNAGRQNQFQVFHLGFPQYSSRYNALGNYSRITEMATRTTNQLPGEGESAAFKEYSWRTVNVIARALHELGDRTTYERLRVIADDVEPLMIRYLDEKLLTDPRWRERLEALAKLHTENDMPRRMEGRSLKGYLYYLLIKENLLEVNDDIARSLYACFDYEKSYYSKLISSLGPLLEKLTSGMTGQLLSPDYFDLDDPRHILDWKSVIRQKGIVYVGLDSMSDPTVAGAVGQSMLADLVSVAGEIYKFGAFRGTPSRQATPNIRLHFDELNEIIGNEFIPMVNKCRGAGMVVTAYTQALQDIEVKLENAAKAEQVVANFNNIVMMRVRNRSTAELLTDQLPEVSVNTVMAVTGVTDSDYTSGSHFTSRNEDRISQEKTRMLDPSALMQLPNGQAFAFIEAGRLYKLRIPMPVVEEKDKAIPEYLDEMVAYMNQQIVTSDWAREGQWWRG